MEFPCQCTLDEVRQAAAAPDLAWTKDVPLDLLQWRPLGEHQPLWFPECARLVCARVLDARAIRDFKVEKKALRLRPDLRSGWSKRDEGETPVDYIRRNLARACVRWMRATDPKRSRRAEKSRRARKKLLGSRRYDLFSPEAKRGIHRL